MKFDVWSRVQGWEVQGLYSGVWERCTTEYTWEDANIQRNSYDNNERGVSHRVRLVTAAPEDIPGSKGKASVVRYNAIWTVKEFMQDQILNTIRDSHYRKRTDTYYTMEYMESDIAMYRYTVKVVFGKYTFGIYVARTYKGRIVDWVPWKDFDWYVRRAENAAQ